jgi:hypothetical protein
MHTNNRLHTVWGLMILILLIGMSCSLLGGGAETPNVEDEQFAPPAMPTVEGISQEELPIPLVPDAANFSSSQASFSYTTQLSAEEVAKFYEEKLPPLGWTIKQQGDMGGTLMWEIARSDVTYLLVITPSNGMTVVDAAPLK